MNRPFQLADAMAALFLKDLLRRPVAADPRREELWLRYGSQRRGERGINEKEAAVVQRIYQDYAAGKSPLVIIFELNQWGIPGPSGDRWNASAAGLPQEAQRHP